MLAKPHYNVAMVNILAFLITGSQLALFAAAYFLQWVDVLALIGVYFSPVFIFFSMLGAALEFDADLIHYWMLVGLVFCFIKYFLISRAISYDGMGFCDYSAIAFEVIYLIASTYYVIVYSFL